MDLIDRIKDVLAREYGIHSEKELMEAIEKQPGLDIGIFTSPCGMEVANVQIAS